VTILDVIGVRKRTGIRTRYGLRRVAGKLCPYCKVEMSKGPPGGVNGPNAPTRDHIIALSRGGPDCVENIQMICRRCNEEKGSLLPEEFVAWREGRASRLDIGPSGRICARVKPYYIFMDKEVGWVENPINVARRRQLGSVRPHEQ
jgi:hypothetical protein